jgi:uncharacterized repeat protein (TIGR03803 family)
MCWKRTCALFWFCMASANITAAQTITTLVNFDGTNGANPEYGSLVQATNGDLYGTTYYGGANNGGTVFKINPSGVLTTLYSFSFDFDDGNFPYAGLIQDTNGNLYGTTAIGPGPLNGGTIFSITPAGALTMLYSFCHQPDCADGEKPIAGLVEAANKSLYGTTYYGGVYGWGAVFRIAPSGVLSTVYSFCQQPSCPDGELPTSGLIQATDGNLYGTTSQNLNFESYGTIYRITPDGVFTGLHRFNGTDGAAPNGLLQATNGQFYGTTADGGANVNNNCGLGCGTVFEMTSTGALITLHSFDLTDGAYPSGELLQASDRNLYGTTSSGGAHGFGTIFKISSAGLTTLHNFDGTDGGNPSAGLVQATNGDFYGTTYFGGASNACLSGCGTVFRLSLGLPPS